jgi:hypothetical protein
MCTYLAQSSCISLVSKLSKPQKRARCRSTMSFPKHLKPLGCCVFTPMFPHLHVFENIDLPKDATQKLTGSLLQAGRVITTKAMTRWRMEARVKARAARRNQLALTMMRSCEAEETRALNAVLSCTSWCAVAYI